MDKYDCVILGAGITGLSTAYHLKNHDYGIYEKESRTGGMCKTERIGEFLFDYAEHFIRPDEAYVKNTLKNLLGKNIHSQIFNSAIYLSNSYVEYPFQLHLYGLPHEMIEECLLGYMEAYYEKKKKPLTFEDWILQNLGRGIAVHFMIPYNEKRWCIHPREMSFDWFSNESIVPKGNLRMVLDGALHKTAGEQKYRWYPLRGGIESLSRAITSRVRNLSLGKKAVKVLLEDKKIEFEDGSSVAYDKLVNTIPLPEFIRIAEGAPREIRKAAGKLRHTSVLCVNLGIDKKRVFKRHWIYFPEKEFLFSKVYFPMKFSTWMGPKRKSSVSAIITYSGKKRIREERVIERTIDDLIETEILEGDEDIILRHLMNIEYGFNVPTLDTKKNVDLIRNFLFGHDIYSIGRYGKWEYSGIEHSILDGKEMALILKSR